MVAWNRNRNATANDSWGWGDSHRVWTQWVTTATTTASTTAACDVWTSWIVSGTGATTATVTNAVTWGRWVETDNCRVRKHLASAAARDFSQRTRVSPEEIARRQAQEQQARANELARQLEVRLAAARAERILRENLNAEQKEDLEKKGCFYLTVHNRDGKQERYRIDRGSHGNIKLLDEKGSIKKSLCVAPEGNMPAADAMLAQKLYLESSEETRKELWDIANVTHYEPGGLQRVTAGRVAAR